MGIWGHTPASSRKRATSHVRNPSRPGGRNLGIASHTWAARRCYATWNTSKPSSRLPGAAALVFVTYINTPDTLTPETLTTTHHAYWNHHGWKRALGHATRSTPYRRSCRRCKGRPGDRRDRRPGRHRHPHPVCVLRRQLEPAAGGNRGAHEAVRSIPV